MKKNFSQQFRHTKPRLAYLLVELEPGKFVHQSFRDELELEYFNPFQLEIDKSQDEALQIAKFLYNYGLSLNSYREVARQTDVSFGLIDDTPGTKREIVCLHIKADRTVSFNSEFKVSTLVNLFVDFRDTPDMPPIVKLGIAQIFNERDAFLYLIDNH